MLKQTSSRFDASRVTSGQELTVTPDGKPVLKLSPLTAIEPSLAEREALLEKPLSIRMTRSIGKNFERSDGYDDQVKALVHRHQHSGVRNRPRRPAGEAGNCETAD